MIEMIVSGQSDTARPHGVRPLFDPSESGSATMTTIFKDHTRENTNLRLLRATSFDCGGVVLQYVRGG